MIEDMELEMKVKESELIQKSMDEKEKNILSDKKERRKHEEEIR